MGDHEMSDFLLSKDTSIACQADNKQKAPIRLAAENGQVSVLKALLDSCPDTIQLLNGPQQNILHIAAKKGTFDAVSFILKLPEVEDLVNAPDADGNIPLHLAAKNFHSSVVYILSRERKTKVRTTNRANQTALGIVLSEDDRGLELQHRLTLKALQSAYEKCGVNIEEIVEEEEEGLDETQPKRPERGTKSREMAQTLSFMATLIATFTFTAVFTLPGGFKSNSSSEEGTALLIHKRAFQAFVITDTIAMTCSITAAVIVFWSRSHPDHESFMDTLLLALGLTWVSLVAMALAFVIGLFAVLSTHQWLAIVVCFIGCSLPAVLYVLAPLFLLMFDRRSSSQTSASRRYYIVENNPFVFIVRFIKTHW